MNENIDKTIGGKSEDLCKEFEKEGAETFENIVKTFPRYINLLTPLQSEVLREYYLQEKSPIQIQFILGKNSAYEVVRIIKRGKKSLLNLYLKMKESKGEK